MEQEQDQDDTQAQGSVDDGAQLGEEGNMLDEQDDCLPPD